MTICRIRSVFKLLQLKSLLFIFLLNGQSLTYAQEQASGPLVQIAQAFIGGAGNMNIESATLGIDKGIIANTVIGIGRTVERNPNPQGNNDHYLVKDRMKLGFELGAGFVAAGTITYAQEWTLVYPVAKNMSGLLSRKFVVDLFLFYRASKLIKESIPGNYALLRESYIEGKGRLKIGGSSGLLLGNQASASRIKLETILIKAQGNDKSPLKVMRQKSKYRKLAYELWINLIAFDLPLFDASNDSGTLEREYLEANYSRLDKPKREKLMRALFSGQDNSAFKDFKTSRVLTSKFKEISLDFTLFYAFDRQRLTRIDDLTDTIMFTNEKGETKVASSRTWQWENRGNHEWTTGLKSEQYKSRIFLTGTPQEDSDGVTTQILEPQLKMELEVVDGETSLKEINKIYWPLLSDFSNQRKNIDQLNQLSFNHEPETRSSIEIQLNKDALQKILNTRDDEWFDALKIVTGKKGHYWRNSASGGLHSRDRRRLRQSRLPLGDVQLASQVNRLILATKKARKEMQRNRNVLALRKLLRGLRSSFTIGSGAFDTRLLKVILAIAGQDNQFSKTKMQYFNGDQITELKSSRGEPQWSESGEYQFLFEDPSEIYFFFEERLNP